MENNTNNKSLLIITAAAVVIFAIMVAGMVRANETNREFEHNMAIQGYEQQSILGQNGVYWGKRDSK